MPVRGGAPPSSAGSPPGAAFRSVAERHGAIEITEVRRQRDDWQRLAMRQLATGRTAEAVHIKMRQIAGPDSLNTSDMC